MKYFTWALLVCSLVIVAAACGAAKPKMAQRRLTPVQKAQTNAMNQQMRQMLHNIHNQPMPGARHPAQ